MPEKPVFEEESRTVSSTVIEVGSGKVTAYRLGNLTVLAVSGTLSPSLFQKLEQQAKKSAASIGLDLADLKGVAPSLVPGIEKLRLWLVRRGHDLVLLNPPSQLLDLLELQGLLGKYSIEETAPSEKEPKPEKPETDKDKEKLKEQIKEKVKEKIKEAKAAKKKRT